MDINKYIGVGRIAGDIKFTPKQGKDGHARAAFTLAVNRMRGEEADYLPVVCWDKTAENVSQYCAKGKEVGVEGSLRTSGTKDEATGKWTNYWSINAQIVSFGRDSKKQQASGSEAGVPVETDMGKLAKKLAEAQKVEQAKNMFDESVLREELAKNGIIDEAIVSDLITRYKAQHGLASDAAAPAESAAAAPPASDPTDDGRDPF